MLVRKPVWIVASGLVALALLVGACTPGAAAVPTQAPQPTSAPSNTQAPQPTTPPAAPEFSGSATITFVQEPDTLNYGMYSTMWFSQIAQQFWSKGLWSFDENSEPVLEIAAEIPSVENGGLSEDGQTITLRLNPAVTWSDGTPLTSEDFVFTYEMVMSDANVVLSRSPYEEHVASVEAPDPQTVVVHMTDSYAAWLTTLFTTVLPKHVLQPVFESAGTLDGAEWHRAPTVGVGPFVFSEWEPQSHLIFTANPNWIRPPKLEQIVIRFTPDDAAQEAAILAGDTDIGVFLDASQVERLEADGTIDVVGTPGGFDEAWFLNVNAETAHPAMLDVNVRRALALATDRFSIVEDLLDPEINPVNVTFWDNTPGYETRTLEPLPYDPDEAARLLDEAGWVDTNGNGTRDKDDVELVLRYITNQRELRMNMQAVVQQQLAAVGIGTELVNYSSDVFWNGYNDEGPQAKGEYDIAQYSSAPLGPPDPEASANWECDQIASADNPDGANWQGYCNADLETLLDEQAVTADPQARRALYEQIQQIMFDEMIYVGIWKDPDLWSIHESIQNVRLSGPTPFWNAHEWTVTP
ncbi:MAG: peptide ABC transporter substrate-binding protein [Anaerolineales bacterium]|nr:peptide ABC transporter substrate-binding protein [Anaerolineales bacterium]